MPLGSSCSIGTKNTFFLLSIADIFLRFEDSASFEASAITSILIELASSPGGVDVSSAKRLGSQVLWASSLPGKYAPESAGELIADCVRNIASEVGL